MNPINIGIMILFPISIFLIVVGFGKRSQLREIERAAQQKIRSDDIMGAASIRLEKLELSLERTGIALRLQSLINQSYLRISPIVFLGAFLGLFSLVFITLWAYLKVNLFVNILFSLSTAILSAWMYLKGRKNLYIDELVKQMPQVAIILSNAMKAGMTVTQAINLVAQRVSWPAKDEFKKVSQEISLGFSVEEALNRLAKRVNIKEINTIVITIQVLRQSGGNLSQALSIMANAIMGRERVRAEIRAVTSEARYTGLALLILPLLILVMLNSTQPGSVSRFLDKPVGVIIMVLFIAVQFASFIMINKFAEIEV